MSKHYHDKGVIRVFKLVVHITDDQREEVSLNPGQQRQSKIRHLKTESIIRFRLIPQTFREI